ncbi:hypothetical protein ScPMuIL_000702 [Solemya velum]
MWTYLNAKRCRLLVVYGQELDDKNMKPFLGVEQPVLLFLVWKAEAQTNNSSNATETETASDVPKIVVTVIFFVFIVVASVIVSRLVNRYIENRKNSISDFEEIDRTDIIVMSRLAYMQRKRSTIVRNKHEGAKKDKEKNNTNVYTTANSKIFEEIEVSSDNGSALEKAKSTPKVETKSKKQINTTLQPIFELPIPEKKPSSDRVIKTAIIEPKTKCTQIDQVNQKQIRLE